jgi:hypothetical protein
MRNVILPAALAVALSVTPALAQTPQAADQTLGMALLSAAVRTDGTLMRGAGVTSVVREAVGLYTVTFNRSLTACMCVASIGSFFDNDIVGPSPNNNATATCPTANGNATASVRTGNANANTQNDLPFHLIVFCPK